MTVIREADDFHEFDEAPILADVLASALSHPGRCALCGAAAPSDVLWPSFALELEHKDSLKSTGDIEFCICPTCEPRMDAILDAIIASEHP